MVRVFTRAAKTVADGYAARLVDRFCRLAPGSMRPSAPFSVALYAGLGKR
jgi:hypothetical protein